MQQDGKAIGMLIIIKAIIPSQFAYIFADSQGLPEWGGGRYLNGCELLPKQSGSEGGERKLKNDYFHYVYFIFLPNFTQNTISMLTYPQKRQLNTVVIVLLTATLFSCLNPHMINRWVAHHYSPDALEPARQKNNQIVITSKLPDMGPQPSTTEKKWTHVIPAVVYWHIDYQNICSLNPQIAINRFTAAISTYGGKLKAKLNGGHLELTIQQMPTVFLVDDRGYMIFPIYSVEWLSIQPTITDMVVSYRLLDDHNADVKTGSISIADPEVAVGLKMWHSLKKMTWEYLDQHDDNVTAMSRKFVDKLVAEL